jgi:hypothetical protein
LSELALIAVKIAPEHRMNYNPFAQGLRRCSDPAKSKSQVKFSEPAFSTARSPDFNAPIINRGHQH